MNRDNIIRMAYDAGIRVAPVFGDTHPNNVYWHEVERFAKLVAAAERKKWIASADHFSSIGTLVEEMKKNEELSY